MINQSSGQFDVRCLFEPRSVAVVGTSPTNRPAIAALSNLRAMGFDGPVGGVHPRHDEVAGVECAPSLTELAFVPQAVVVVVNRDRVVSVLEEAAAIGTRAAVIAGIGFAEIGATGIARQEEVKRIADSAGMAVLGPNCQGVINFSKSVALYGAAVNPYTAGTAGLIAQSGSIMTALTNNRRGVMWRYAVSSGNEAVVDAADLLAYMVEDDECRVACLFLETVRDPDRFFDLCDRALERDLPVVVMKTGKTEASMRAAEAHSGALAAPDRLVEARFERHGVHRVHTLEELLETANALQMRHRPQHGGLATLTGSGGQIEIMLDTATEVGLEHPSLTGSTTATLGRMLPDFLPAQNPLDWWGTVDPDATYPRLVRALASDPNVDVVVTVIDQTDYPTGEGRFQPMWDTAIRLAPEHDELFVLLETVGGVASPERIAQAAAAGVLVVSGYEPGLEAVKHLVDHARRLARPRGEPLSLAGAEGRALPSETTVGGQAALDHLARCGIPVAPTRRVYTVDAAAAVAGELGFPLVAKLGDDSVLHKTERGGVVTGIADDRSLNDGVTRLIEHDTDGGVLLQPQLTGVEVIVGVNRHPELGPFLLVGLGGIWTEVLKAVTVVPAGLCAGEAAAILHGLTGSELLRGARGTPPADLDALAGVVERVDAIARELDDTLDSLDINPVIASPHGALAVDAVIVPAGSAPQDDSNGQAIVEGAHVIR